MLSEWPAGVPGGTSLTSCIRSGFLTSPHRGPMAPIDPSSNCSTKITFGLFSMPTSPGYSADSPPLGGGGGVVVFDTVIDTAVDVVLLPAASRAIAVRTWAPLEVPVLFQVVE